MNRDLKTVQIFLPHGDPHGIRIAELAGHAAQVADVPRHLLRAYSALPDSAQEGVYILVGDRADPIAEIRVEHSRALGSQLAAHELLGRDWTRALLLSSRFVSLSEKDARYLAWLCRRDLQRPGVPAELGGAAPHKPRVVHEVGAACRDLWATGKLLLAVLGYAYLDHGAAVVGPLPSIPAPAPKRAAPLRPATPPVATQRREARSPGKQAKSGAPEQPATPGPAFAPAATSPNLTRTYRCTLLGSDAYGGPTPDGFVVLQGAHGPRRDMPRLPEAHRQFRQELIHSGILRVVGRDIVLDHDHLFPTSTLAAIALTGSTCDGGMEWKTEDERTLFAMTRVYGRDDR